MPWIVALLRGQKVLARASTDGSFVVDGGRVEIRYRKTDPRAYRAAAANLSIVPGEPLVPDADVVGHSVRGVISTAVPECRAVVWSPHALPTL